MLTDKCTRMPLWARMLTVVGVLAAAPVLAGPQRESQAQSCDFGNTTVTVGDVATASGLSNTQGGQSMIDAAGVTVAPKTPVPEPGSLAIFGAGLIALYSRRRCA